MTEIVKETIVCALFNLGDNDDLDGRQVMRSNW